MRSASLGVIFLIVFLDLLGFGILIPQLGVYGLRFGASPWVVGLLLSTFSLMQFLFAPVLGRLSDRYGRRPVLLVSVAGSCLGYLFFAFAQSLPALFFARIVDGISGANVSTAQAYVADVTTTENRSRGMGLVGAAFGLGFILGPAVGGGLGAWGGNRAIGLFAAGLAALNWGLAFFLLPESLRPGSLPARRPLVRGLGELFALPEIGRVLVVSLLFVTAFAQMEGTFSVFLTQRHVVPDAAGADLYRQASLKAGYLFAAVGIVSAVIQGGLIGRLVSRFGERRVLSGGLGLAAVGLGAIPWMPNYAWLFAPMAALSAGSALVTPSLSSLASLRAPEGRQGEVLGAYQSTASLGRILGPTLGGLLLVNGGGTATYTCAAAMAALAFAVSLLPALHRQPGPEPLRPF